MINANEAHGCLLLFCFFVRYPWNWFEIKIEFYINARAEIKLFGEIVWEFEIEEAIWDPIILTPARSNPIAKIAVQYYSGAVTFRVNDLTCQSMGGSAGNEGL